jgi:transposase
VDHCGIDLGKYESQVAIITEAGELVEKRLRTERPKLQAFFGECSPMKVLMEASPESEWVARCLEEIGHQVFVADPNFAPMYAQRSRTVKTDRRDALALAEACRLGAYRPAHRTTDEQRHVRALVVSREALVRGRAKYVVVVQSLLRREGIRIAKGTTPAFGTRVQQVSLPAHLHVEIDPILALLAPLNEQIRTIDKLIAQKARNDSNVARLMTCPQIGALTAAAFVAALDSADRFAGPHQVESYLGLVPREWSSGESQRKGSITKAGNRRMRYLLVEAAQRILMFKRPDTMALSSWAQRIAKRRGKKTAIVALARRLAGILFAMWRDKTRYDPTRLGLCPEV